MKNNKKEKNNKKKLLVASSIGLLTILEGRLAYFTISTNITNVFKVALYQNNKI